MASCISQKAFDRSFYLWSRSTVLHELENGFPLLRLVKNALVTGFTSAIASYPEGRQFDIALARVKQFNQKGAMAAEDPFSETEQDIAEEFGNRLRELLLVEGLKYRQREVDAPKLNRTRFTKLVRERLRRLFPDEPRTCPGGIRVYLSTSRNCKVFTEIDFGGRFTNLTYSHSIVSPENIDLNRAPFSILSWTGVAAQTSWDSLTENDEAEVAEAVEKLCSHFINSLDSILAPFDDTSDGKDAR